MMMERLYESIKVRPHPNQLNAHFGSTTVDNAATTGAIRLPQTRRPTTKSSSISSCNETRYGYFRHFSMSAATLNRIYFMIK